MNRGRYIHSSWVWSGFHFDHRSGIINDGYKLRVELQLLSGTHKEGEAEDAQYIRGEGIS